MSDPVEQFLGTDFGNRGPAQLRERIFEQTTRLIRRRRRKRRLVWMGAMAASFLAGTLAMGYWQSATTNPQPTLTAGLKQIGGGLHGKLDEAAKPASAAALAERPLTALDLEWRAFDSKDNRAALLFAAAKSYLDERQDYVSATRCYRQALDELPPEELAIRPDDNWLVMALKEARLKEMNDAIGNP